MITICSTPTCDKRYNGPAAESESKGGWRIRQCGPVCPACVAKESDPVECYLIDHVVDLSDYSSTREQLALRVTELERQLADKDSRHFATVERLVAESRQEITRLTNELNDSRRDNAHLNTIIENYHTIIDNYQRHDLEQFTELEGRGKS